ncbi:hypothetical protein B296_00013580 [Ensete ventricosum]|uniref:Uncharacterized protein n=1 Tax=Ensete ventricosum TaxID=4639 RepID=A0A427ATR5_ENSVE|nr:hypothetical protein B296_00013580 [Ensete ventricosum]
MFLVETIISPFVASFRAWDPHELQQPYVVAPLPQVDLPDSRSQETPSGGCRQRSQLRGYRLYELRVGTDVVTSSALGGWFGSMRCSAFELLDERSCDMGPPSSAKMFVKNLRACPVGAVYASESAEWARLVLARVR